LTRLAGIYDAMAQAGLHNLSQIQVLGSMARDLKDGDYIPFDIAPVESALTYESGGKRISIILGENAADGSFYPSVTERMLHVHSQMNLWNGLLPNRKSITVGAVSLLQDIMIFSAHLSRIALYLAATTGKTLSREEREKSFTDFVSALPPYMSKFFNSCLDRAHVSSILQNLRVGDYTIMEYDVTNDGQAVNHYRLPMSMAKPYLAKLEKAKAEAPGTSESVA
jgi:hypothetical protein